MNRRAFVVALALSLLAPSVHAQSDATTTQIELVRAYASLRALETRYGPQHADIIAAQARVDSLIQAMAVARTSGAAIDRDEVTRAIDTEITDIRARIAERSTRCGAGHPDMQTAFAREAALMEARTHVTSDGYFAP